MLHVARLLAMFLSSCAFGGALATPALALARSATPACGALLGPGRHVLVADLECGTPDCPSCGVAILTLSSGAQLDLNGYTIRGEPRGHWPRTQACLNVEGFGARITGGTIEGCDHGIRIDGGGRHQLDNLYVTGNATGLILVDTEDNIVRHAEVSGNFTQAVRLERAHGNRFLATNVRDNSGADPVGGYFLLDSHGNHISDNTIAGNQCFGILLQDSSSNVVRRSTITATTCDRGRTGVNLAIRGDSDGNLISNNHVSTGDDGINTGCRGACGLLAPSGGANTNRLLANIITAVARYGIAQSAGNPENLLADNTVTGSGGADYALDP